jgi:hypothetical protein
MATVNERSREAARALGNVPAQLAALDAMSVNELTQKYRELYGEPTRSRNKDYLRKRLAWRIQENAEGGLSERSVSKIIELGDQLPERWRMRQATSQVEACSIAPPAANARDPRLPPIGAVLTRSHNGASHHVTVLADGFTYDGEHYKTLSAIARHITGTAWNGFSFFGLKANAAGGQT